MSPVTAVMGSAAADLDSLVASIAYAYLLDRESRRTGPVFPYLPIPREGLSLRREAESLFEREGVNSSTLVFADDVDLEDLLGTRAGELVLVDTQGHDLAPVLHERIAEVIDHHPEDRRAYGADGFSDASPSESPPGNTGRPGFPGPLRRRTLEPVGSTCTLVSEQILHRKPEILDRQLATLLLAAVLLDTANLDPRAGRATGRDRRIAGLLMQAGSVDSAGLYEELVLARRDIAGLDSAQLLQKDYKERKAGSLRFGMSSVPVLLDSWRHRDERLEEALFAFLVEKALDLLVVLLYQEDDELKRQLILCGTDEKVLSHAAAGLREPLGLAELSGKIRGGRGRRKNQPAGDTGGFIRGFSQRKTSESRKRIEPRLREILAKPVESGL
jgi:exopolyphosphatase